MLLALTSWPRYDHYFIVYAVFLDAYLSQRRTAYPSINIRITRNHLRRRQEDKFDLSHRH
jgi:hypothetical protein